MCSVHCWSHCHASWTFACTYLPQHVICTYSSTQSNAAFELLKAVDELPSTLTVISLSCCICTSKALYYASCACFSAFDQTHGQSSAWRRPSLLSRSLCKMSICSVIKLPCYRPTQSSLLNTLFRKSIELLLLL